MIVALASRISPASDWLFLVGLLAFYCVCVFLLFVFGKTTGNAEHLGLPVPPDLLQPAAPDRLPGVGDGPGR